MDEHINMDDFIHVLLTWLHSKVRVNLPTVEQKINVEIKSNYIFDVP